MRLLALALLLATFVVAPARAQDDNVRGLYIGSRPKKSTRVPPPASHPGPKTPKQEPRTAPDGPVGLGFSLYRVVDKAHSVRVDASGMFHDGDMLRFVVEPSVDGYLYVFNITDAGAPVMIYPDARLERGDNFVYAHTVAEVPSRRNPKLDIFRVAGGAATEHVYFIVSRTPLAGVPTGDELVRYCDGRTEPCLWGPVSSTWDAIASRAVPGTRVSTKHDAGTAISRIEQDALTRDLKLGASDPEPSVVAVNASTDTPLLIHEVSIRHQ